MNSSQINIILLALGCIQGIFLFSLLFRKRKVTPGFGFLASYLSVLILQILMKIASKIWLMETMRPLYFLSYYLPLLYGPLIWLFIRQTTGRGVRRKTILFHILPFLLFAFCWGLSQNTFVYFPGLLLSIEWTTTFSLLSIGFYHVMAYRELKGHTRWLNQLVISSFLVCSLVSLVIAFMYTYFPRYQDLRFGFSLLTVFIYWISYKAWNRPELFQVITGGAKQETDNLNTAFPLHRVIAKYSNSGLRDEDLQQIISKLECSIRENKSFLNPDLTIDDLAAQLGCSRHHLSQALNKKLNRSFYDFINYYRVEEVSQLLGDPRKNSLKIASLAFDAGFNSISTFNEVFKKTTGLTPSQFRKEREENILRKLRV